MLGTIIKKEIQENLYSYKFVVITLLSVILVLTSIFVMYRDYQVRLADYEDLLPTEEKSTAMLQPTPLSIFAKGMDESLCSLYKFSLVYGISSSAKQQAYNMLFRLFTTPDLLYIVKVVLALCAILFSFSLVSGEKEIGTLRLSLSNSLGRSKLLLGKWIGSFATLVMPFLLAVLLGVILVTLSAKVQMDGEKWLKLAMFLGSSLLYLAFFFSLGLLVSCLYSRSSTAIVIALFLWVLLVFVIPNLGGIAARKLVDIPSAQRLALQKQQAIVVEYRETLRRREEGSEEELPEFDPERNKEIADYRSRFNKQVALTRTITRISPSSVYIFLATDFASTGIVEKLRLKQAFLNYKDILLSQPRGPRGEILGDYPAFNYERSSVKEILASGGLINLTIIILQNLAVFAAAYVAFLRYDVR